jgi:hypothetical protein
MLVSSPGGHLESGDAIHDIIRFITAPVNMIGTGWVGSAATHLYLSVPKERRFCTPNTRFLIHQPSGGAGGPPATSRSMRRRSSRRANASPARSRARPAGPLDGVLEDIERDRWLSAEEAIEYGLVGRIINHKTDIKREEPLLGFGLRRSPPAYGLRGARGDGVAPVGWGEREAEPQRPPLSSAQRLAQRQRRLRLVHRVEVDAGRPALHQAPTQVATTSCRRP